MKPYTRWFVIACMFFAFSLGLIAREMLDGPVVQAQQQAATGGAARSPELPPAIQIDARTFLMEPSAIVRNVFTVRGISGDWVLIETTQTGQSAQMNYQQYWVYAPDYAWGVGGAFRPE
jgi:hypothetical protein